MRGLRHRPLGSGTAATALLALLLGCGGYRAAQSGARAKGRATINVKWPATDARVIPAATQRLLCLVYNGTQQVGGVTIFRPSASGTITNLPYGTLTVKVTAYPRPGGGAPGPNEVLASGTGTMTVTEDTPGTVSVVLDATVATLSLPTTPLAFVRGGTAILTASAADSTGAIVLLPLSQVLTWTTAPAGIVSVAGTGPTVTLTGAAVGDATVAASLVNANGKTVSTGPLAVHVSEPLSATGLASPGYPVTGGDYGASGKGHGPAAAGSVGAALSLGSGAASAVTGPDGAVYAASNTNLAAQTAAGAPLWSVSTGKAVFGLTLTGGGVLLASTATGLEARRADTGELLWSFTADSATLSPPAVGHDGTVFAFTPTTLYAVNGATGAALWHQAATLANRLAIGDNGTLYGHNAAVVSAFSPTTGATLWSKVAYKSDTYGSDVSIVGGTMYLVTGVTTSSPVRAVGRLDLQASVLMDEAGNKPVIRVNEEGIPTTGGFGSVTGGDTGGPTTNATNTTGGFTTGTTGNPTSYTWYTYRSVVALNASDGTLQWAYDLPKFTTTTKFNVTPSFGYLRAAPAVGNGRVVAQFYGGIVGLNAATGAKLWLDGTAVNPSADRPLPSGISLASDGTAYVPLYDSTYANGSTLQALNPATGAVLWSASLGSTVYGFPTVADDGTVYVGTTNGKVVPIR